MIFEADIDIPAIIHEIGDSNFSIREQEHYSYSLRNHSYMNPKYPNSVEIHDCEDNQSIYVQGDSPEEALKMSEALLKLLNMNCREVK